MIEVSTSRYSSPVTPRALNSVPCHIPISLHRFLARADPGHGRTRFAVMKRTIRLWKFVKCADIERYERVTDFVAREARIRDRQHVAAAERLS